MDTDQLLKQFLSEHTDCRVPACTTGAETVRERNNPWWGLDPDNNYRPRTKIDNWLVEVDPGQVEGVCFAHLEWARKSNGSFADPGHKTGTGSGNWMVRKRAEKLRARTELIEELGGACAACQRPFPYEQLRIEVRNQSRQHFDIATQTEWWAFVLVTPTLLKRAYLMCVECSDQAKQTSPSRKSTRDEVVKAYGGRCWHSGCEQTDRLMVAALPGTPQLRWPNGNKYSSVAKLDYLVRSGFPSGWTVTCAAHLQGVQRGSR